MKSLILAAAVLMMAPAPLLFAGPPSGDRGKELTALEQKLVGDWKAQSPCGGRFVFRADGTYELKDYGPAPYDSAGSWKVRWDALPPTLVLTCKTSDIPEEVGKTTEVKLTRLDDTGLAIKHASQDEARYAREKK